MVQSLFYILLWHLCVSLFMMLLIFLVGFGLTVWLASQNPEETKIVVWMLRDLFRRR
jgi:hypothetical protein